MTDLTPEILLLVFKKLNSVEIVNVLRVCKDWLEIIEEHKSLWRRLVLPKRENGWGISAVELFDRNSNSSLEKVEMQIKLNWAESKRMMNLLEKSTATLQTLYLSRGHFQGMEDLSELCWRLPNLPSFRMVEYESNIPVNLTEKQTPKEEGKGFKILWVLTTKTLEEAFSKEPDRFDHLVSLRISKPIKTFRLIKVLIRCPQSLKHLSVHMENGYRPQSFATVNLTRLEVLELAVYPNFPSWLRIPSSCTFINGNHGLISSLPQIEKLWIQDLRMVQSLAITCPHLVELRIVKYQSEPLARNDLGALIDALRQRKDNVNAGMEIEGVKMIPLKRLVFPSKILSQSQLSELRDMVVEVVDLESVERLIEVEV